MRGSRYRIVIQGDCGDMLASLIDGIAVESSACLTAVVASVRDESEFYGLLGRLQDFALHITSLEELGPDAGGSARPQSDQLEFTGPANGLTATTGSQLPEDAPEV